MNALWLSMNNPKSSIWQCNNTKLNIIQSGCVNSAEECSFLTSLNIMQLSDGEGISIGNYLLSCKEVGGEILLKMLHRMAAEWNG